MDNGDLRREPREKQRFLQRAVTAANHRKRHVLEECAVAGGAERHAAAPILLLARNLKLPGRRPRRQDDRPRLDFAGKRRERERWTIDVNVGDGVDLHLGAELLSLLSHPHRELGSGDLVESRIVLDIVGRGNLPAKHLASYNHGGEVGSRTVDSGRETGRS